MTAEPASAAWSDTWVCDSALGVLTDFQERFRIVRAYIERCAQRGHPLQILEAGCGQQWPFDFCDTPYVLTGVDLDPVALDIRKNKEHDLHIGIEGDLRTVSLQDAYYDVVYSAFVLEHVQDAERVLANFARWVKPGGIVVLLFPNPGTVFGFVTRNTPFWSHVLHHRWIKGNRNAGKPGFVPYPTAYDPVLAENNLLRFMQHHGLVLDGAWGFGRSPGFLYWVTRAIGALSLGRLRSDHISCLYIFERPTRSSIDATSELLAVENANVAHPRGSRGARQTETNVESPLGAVD